MTERAEIEALIQDAYAARYRGDLDAVMSFFHEDCSYRMPGAPAPVETEAAVMFMQPSGREAMRAQMEHFIATFEFSNPEVVSLIVDGDKAVLNWHADVLFVPNGRKEHFEMSDIFTIVEGKIASLVQFTDTAAVARLTAA